MFVFYDRPFPHVYFAKNVACFPFNAWLSFQRLCQLFRGYLFCVQASYPVGQWWLKLWPLLPYLPLRLPSHPLHSLTGGDWGAGVVICLERSADLHMAQLMSLPLTVSCFSKIQIGFTFLVPTHQGSVCVCVCVCARVCVQASYPAGQLVAETAASAAHSRQARQCL